MKIKKTNKLNYFKTFIDLYKNEYLSLKRLFNNNVEENSILKSYIDIDILFKSNKINLDNYNVIKKSDINKNNFKLSTYVNKIFFEYYYNLNYDICKTSLKSKLEKYGIKNKKDYIEYKIKLNFYKKTSYPILLSSNEIKHIYLLNNNNNEDINSNLLLIENKITNYIIDKYNISQLIIFLKNNLLSIYNNTYTYLFVDVINNNLSFIIVDDEKLSIYDFNFVNRILDKYYNENQTFIKRLNKNSYNNPYFYKEDYISLLIFKDFLLI